MLQALTLSKSQIDYKQPERNIHDRIYRTSLLVVSGITRGLIIYRINSKGSSVNPHMLFEFSVTP